MRWPYHLFNFLENVSGVTTAPKSTVKPVAITMKNQSVSSLEVDAEDGNSLEFIWQLFINGGPHNPWLPTCLQKKFAEMVGGEYLLETFPPKVVI